MIEDKIYITTSNGVYFIDEKNNEVKNILPTKKLFGIFKRKGYAFFGIAYHEFSGNVIAAFRQRSGTKKHNKPTTDILLYSIDPDTHDSEIITEIKDIHDVHQIAVKDDLVFITDCGKNRIPVYDLNSEDKITMINIGDIRDDINHVNALHIESDFLFIGLNNRGIKESEILRIAIQDCFDANHFQVDILGKATKIKLKDIYHSHDIEKLGEDLIVCSSHQGDIFRVSDSSLLLHSGNWARGLALYEDMVLVGSSEFAERDKRHKENIDGEIKIFNLEPPRKLLKTIKLEGAGQVNDILIVPQKDTGE